MKEPHSNLTLLTQILLGREVWEQEGERVGELKVGEAFFGLNVDERVKCARESERDSRRGIYRSSLRLNYRYYWFFNRWYR